MTATAQTPTAPLDPMQLAVVANRFDAIVREMTNTLLRAGRSAVLTTGRDFSCAIVTGDNRLLASAEGLPVHIFGSHLQTQAMCDLHPDLAEGDAFLHNDPYLGNTHHADHTILVPVHVQGEHLFTAAAKAHQADTGNSLPTTYMPLARDLYEEGALCFPCVRVQRDFRDVADIVRMCQRRIRVPDQWYGDYLAMVGAARIGERRLTELVTKYGIDTIRAFIEAWLDYSERRMAGALRKLPSVTLVGEGLHDPYPNLPEGIPVKVVVTVDGTQGRVDIDLRDNVDAVPAGLNLSEACATNSVVTGIFNVIDADVPHNAGAFRRITVHLRENCVVGIAKHPACCSVATTNVADRLVNAIQSAFAGVGDGIGLAEGGLAMGAGASVVSGTDWRRDGAPYVNQLMLSSNGGPASPAGDGWVTYTRPVAAGLLYRDSVEVDEQKYPILFRERSLVRDSGGAGRYRGAPAGRIVYGPRRDPMTVVYQVDGGENAPQGVRGGLAGATARIARIGLTGAETTLPSVGSVELRPGEWVVGADNGGGGYGQPVERDPESVLADVLEGWVSREQAEATYGVVLADSPAGTGLTVNREATTARRRALAGGDR
jgi:N-methylhydantoinase B